MPRLTVFMPAFNAAPFIARSVRTTLRAMPRDAGLLVFDDGSTDDTAAEAERGGRGDPRLRIVRGPGSGSPGGAAVAAMQHVDSEFVGRVDADDITLPGRFSAQMGALSRHDFVFSQMMPFSTRPPRLGAPAPWRIGAEAMPLRLLLGNPVPQPTATMRTVALERAGGYADVVSEDYELWLRAAATGARMTRIPSYGVLYRRHATQTTQLGGYFSRSWFDPVLAESFGRLSRLVTGTTLPRLVSLTPLPAEARAEAYGRFRRAFLQACDDRPLSRTERLGLARALRRRIAWVEGRAAAAPPSASRPTAGA